ncbi:MAG: aminotransferase class III-fold pyridoxal phosphate-dependent enzyme, partial [Paracoccaceae bacterium]
MDKRVGKNGSSVFPRHTAAHLPTAVGGDGVYLIDSNGKRYLDACGGAAVSCLGHSARAVTDAVARQLSALPYAHTSYFTSDAAERLASRLVGYSDGALDKVYFVSGGSEAVETALKLARQYHLEAGAQSRAHFIARKQSYHGNTLGALGAGGNQTRKAPYQPMLAPVFHHIDPCHFWRWGAQGEKPAHYGLRMANQLEDKILELGPKNVAAFIAETVVGATMGAVPATRGYFTRIREICDKYGVLLILDEVMCGMGRTGSIFAWQQEG